jgi:hypothetical protein
LPVSHAAAGSRLFEAADGDAAGESQREKGESEQLAQNVASTGNVEWIASRTPERKFKLLPPRWRVIIQK